jgi:hypothetical protein
MGPYGEGNVKINCQVSNTGRIMGNCGEYLGGLAQNENLTQSLILSMPRRMEEVIAKNGQMTKY